MNIERINNLRKLRDEINRMIDEKMGIVDKSPAIPYTPYVPTVPYTPTVPYNTPYVPYTPTITTPYIYTRTDSDPKPMFGTVTISTGSTVNNEFELASIHDLLQFEAQNA